MTVSVSVWFILLGVTVRVRFRIIGLWLRLVLGVILRTGFGLYG